MTGKHALPKMKTNPFRAIVRWVRESLGDEGKRGSIYGLATAVLAVLTAYGVCTAEDAAQYGEAIATGLTTLAALLARANTGKTIPEVPSTDDNPDVVLSIPVLEEASVEDA